MDAVNETMTVKTPWVKHLGDVPAHLEYPDCSMYENLPADTLALYTRDVRWLDRA